MLKWYAFGQILLLMAIASNGEFLPDTNTVALWHFNENSGIWAYDSSGNQNNGMIYGATRVNGIFGKALQFNGQNEYVMVPTVDNQSGMSQLTLEAWAYIDGSQANHARIVGKMGGGGLEDDSYTLEIDADGRAFFVASGPLGYLFQYTTNIVPTNRWIYLAGVYTGDSIYVYENGILNSKGYLNGGAIRVTTEPIYIGLNIWSDSVWFKGMIDEVRISKSARSAAEIYSSYMNSQVIPKLISAQASDGVIQYPGIDNDDYVLLTFSNSVDTSIWRINKSTIDSLLPLNHNHTWLSGFGTLGDVEWSSDFTKGIIGLSTLSGQPTISVNDSISFLKGSEEVLLQGSFDPPTSAFRSKSVSRTPSIGLYDINGTLHIESPFFLKHIGIFDVSGKHLLSVDAKGNDFHWDHGGLSNTIIMIQIESDRERVTKVISLSL